MAVSIVARHSYGVPRPRPPTSGVRLLTTDLKVQAGLPVPEAGSGWYMRDGSIA
jgi:hypothetical protein